MAKKLKYRWGDIVISTQAAKSQLDIPKGTKGICLGMFSPLGIRVLIPNRVTAGRYHVNFWRNTGEVIPVSLDSKEI